MSVDQQDSCTVSKASSVTSCEVSMKSLGTNRVAVGSLGRVLGTSRIAVVSSKSLDTSRIDGNSQGRVWGPAGCLWSL